MNAFVILLKLRPKKKKTKPHESCGWVSPLCRCSIILLGPSIVNKEIYAHASVAIK